MCKFVGMSLSGYAVGSIDGYVSSCSDVVTCRLVDVQV